MPAIHLHHAVFTCLYGSQSTRTHTEPRKDQSIVARSKAEVDDYADIRTPNAPFCLRRDFWFHLLSAMYGVVGKRVILCVHLVDRERVADIPDDHA